MASSIELDGADALVTGASGGIGRAVSHRLARAGARVWMVARDADRLEAAAREVGGRALAADMANARAVSALRDRIAAERSPAIVVNAAGTFDLAPVAETEPDMFDRMIDGNLRAPFLVIRAFLPDMLSAGRGHLVTIGSVAGRVAFSGNGAYSASKFGVRGLHEVMVQELRGSGVRCTLIDPAATDTALWDPVRPDSRPDLPSRDDMLSADAVADAVLYAVTRPPDTHVPTIAVQRS